MEIQIFQVDAFTDKVFCGNPAAVCPLEHWIPDNIMQHIAMENSLSETVFFVEQKDGFEIRWFTPEFEIDLCGHATLAAAHIIARHMNFEGRTIKFYSKSGVLNVGVEEAFLTLDFPSRKPEPVDIPDLILELFKVKPLEVLKSRDLILVYENEESILNLKPDLTVLNQINLDLGGIAVTAKGNNADFVSRFFVPQSIIFEDPVTGSAHCSLIPYWSEKLGKKIMEAQQLSSRKGKLFCEDSGERVLISGKAVTYMEGKITI